MDRIQQRFELLKMARQLLNEDYINRRAEDHNKWVAENEELWRLKGRHVPYPKFVEFPTDEEIIRVATNMYKFIYETEVESKIEDKMPEVEEEDNGIILLNEEISPLPFTFPPQTTPSPIIEDTDPITDEDSAVKKLLPRWAKRSK